MEMDLGEKINEIDDDFKSCLYGLTFSTEENLIGKLKGCEIKLLLFLH